MITSKKLLKEFLIEDKKALGIENIFPPILGYNIWKFQIALRHLEYCINTRRYIRGVFWNIVYRHYKFKLGFDIPPNTFDMGLNIHHYGCIVVNKNARIGKNCNIQQCVNIGQNYDCNNVPIIGDNVYIGPGAKIFGKIRIANNVAIGAGAIVNKSCDIENAVIVGNPAHIVSYRKNGIS